MPNKSLISGFKIKFDNPDNRKLIANEPKGVLYPINALMNIENNKLRSISLKNNEQTIISGKHWVSFNLREQKSFFAKLFPSKCCECNEVKNNTSYIEHEATVSKINEDQLFYLMSRGISKKDAVQMVIMGFIEPFSKELPMEYAVELNQLIKMDMEGSVG